MESQDGLVDKVFERLVSMPDKLMRSKDNLTKEHTTKRHSSPAKRFMQLCLSALLCFALIPLGTSAAYALADGDYLGYGSEPSFTTQPLEPIEYGAPTKAGSYDLSKILSSYTPSVYNFKDDKGTYLDNYVVEGTWELSYTSALSAQNKAVFGLSGTNLIYSGGRPEADLKSIVLEAKFKVSAIKLLIDNPLPDPPTHKDVTNDITNQLDPLVINISLNPEDYVDKPLYGIDSSEIDLGSSIVLDDKTQTIDISLNNRALFAIPTLYWYGSTVKADVTASLTAAKPSGTEIRAELSYDSAIFDEKNNTLAVKDNKKLGEGVALSIAYTLSDDVATNTAGSSTVARTVPVTTASGVPVIREDAFKISSSNLRFALNDEGNYCTTDKGNLGIAFDVADAMFYSGFDSSCDVKVTLINPSGVSLDYPVVLVKENEHVYSFEVAISLTELEVNEYRLVVSAANKAGVYAKPLERRLGVTSDSSVLTFIVEISDSSSFDASHAPYYSAERTLTVTLGKEVPIRNKDCNLSYKQDGIEQSLVLSTEEIVTKPLGDGTYDFSDSTFVVDMWGGKHQAILKDSSLSPAPTANNWHFTIDTTVPYVKVGLPNALLDAILASSWAYKDFISMSTEILVEGVTEGGSGIKKIEYLSFENSGAENVLSFNDYGVTISGTEYKDPEDVKAFLESQAGSFTTLIDYSDKAFGAEAKEGSSSIKKDPQRNLLVFAKVTANNGLVSYACSNGMVIDSTAPEAHLNNKAFKPAKTGTSQKGIDIYNKSTLENTLEIKDPSTDDKVLGSGLKEASYELRKSDRTPIKGQAKTLPCIELSQDGLGSDVLNKACVVTENLNLDKLEDANDLELWVCAQDNAGNYLANSALGKNVYSFSIDTTAPVIEIAKPQGSAKNTKYYNNDVSFEITITDRNLNPNNEGVLISSASGAYSPHTAYGASSTKGWKLVSEDKTGMQTWSKTIVFQTDGDYCFKVEATDLAGNVAKTQTSSEVVVDKTVPVVTISYDNNDARNDKYFNAARTATITVVEHNFAAQDMNVQATRDGQAIGTSAFSTNKDTHTATLDASQDGSYMLEVSYSDLAGNIAQVSYEGSATQDFVIDTTPPTIEFVGVLDHNAYSDVIAPSVIFTDTNYDTSSKRIDTHTIKDSADARAISYASLKDGERADISDMAHIPANDDIYTISASVVDLAGNSAEAQITYSINRFGSTWYVEDATKTLLDKYHLSEEQEITLHEVNVSEIQEHTVSVALNGTTSFFEEAAYKVSKQGGTNTWHENTYVMPAKNFETEGLHEITVSSTDAAKNTSSNRSTRAESSACPLDFVIDKTAPSIVVTGIKNNGSYAQKAQRAVIDVEDNFVIECVEVYLDDNKEPAKSFAAEDIKKAHGTLSYDVVASASLQTITVKAYDKAGNHAEDAIVKDIFVNQNAYLALIAKTPFAPLVQNLPLLYALTALVGLLALGGLGVGGTMFARRKLNKTS
jgi:hypothetical protein